MTRYEEVCADNKVLYGEVEILAMQISACNETNSEYDVEYLKTQKGRLMALIDLNLEKIQKIWDREELTYKRPNKFRQLFTPTRLEKLIIDSYRGNPNQTIAALGIKHNLKNGAADAVITKLLNKQYIGY